MHLIITLVAKIQRCVILEGKIDKNISQSPYDFNHYINNWLQATWKWINQYFLNNSTDGKN